ASSWVPALAPEPRPTEALEARYRYGPLPVLFLARPNRYLARVRFIDSGRVRSVHVPNPGRMGELLLPGRTTGWAVPAPGELRKTHFDLVAVRHRGSLVSIDSRIANRLVGRLLEAGSLPEFGPGPWRAECPWGGSRLDFGVPSGLPGRYRALLEVKSSNLRVGSWALFPDAPTVRGTRHLHHLAAAARSGISAGVLFAVQRDDVRWFRPNDALDPEFGAALREAHAAGVVIVAGALKVRPGGVRWGRRLPVRLA
ncbi:MAG: DNA/RNA nuclease SfsA, partial [Thermoplasmata archaeon]